MNGGTVGGKSRAPWVAEVETKAKDKQRRVKSYEMGEEKTKIKCDDE